jgi:hypothetical protein
LPKPSPYYRPPVRAKNNRDSSMGRIDDKLNNIFKDDAADDILGPVKTKTPVRRAPNTQIEKNFAEVVAFFEEHGRLPEEGSDDGAEAGLWAKFDGIRIRDDFRGQVAHMDKFGLLNNDKLEEDTLNVQDECSGMPKEESDRSVAKKTSIQSLYEQELDIFSLKHACSPLEKSGFTDLIERSGENGEGCPICENDPFADFPLDYFNADIRAIRYLLENTQNKIRANTEYLADFEFSLTPCPRCLLKSADSLDDIAASINTISKALRDKCKELNVEAFKANLSNSPEPNDEKNSPIPQPCEYAECAPSSLDDILQDESFDELFDGNEDSDSDNILGGRRAIKSHERENVDQTNREPCPSFETYRERFEQYKQAMEDGKLVVSANRSETLSSGDLFLWDGFIALLSGESIKGDVKEHSGKRLHVVFSNGTEAWLREGSIKRSMYAYTDRGNKVVCKRLVPVSKDLFTADDSGTADENTVTGYIYIVRTLSKDPSLTKIRKSAVKIGVTKNPVAVRVANAEKDPTFLCAPVDIVHTFTLHNLNPRKVEETLHAFFGEVRLKIGAKDRFGNDVTANEWFLVSPKIVEKAIRCLIENSLNNLSFNKADGKIHHKQIADKDS